MDFVFVFSMKLSMINNVKLCTSLSAKQDTRQPMSKSARPPMKLPMSKHVTPPMKINARPRKCGYHLHASKL